MGKIHSRYEERRALEAENRLLQEQKLNERLKREAEEEVAANLVLSAVKEFFAGQAEICIDYRAGLTFISWRQKEPTHD